MENPSILTYLAASLLIFSSTNYIGHTTSFDANEEHGHLKYPLFTEPILVVPAKHNYSCTMIFLHGFGDNGHTAENFVTGIRTPHMKVICPTSNVLSLPDPHRDIHAWYDFGHHKEFENNDLIRITQATQFVHHLIDEEVKHGIKPEHIVVVGYSQGSSLAIHSVRTYPKRLAGIVVFEEWPHINETEQYAKEENLETPILHLETHNHYFKTAKAPENMKFTKYNKVVHAITIEEFEKVRNFFAEKIDGKKIEKEEEF